MKEVKVSCRQCGVRLLKKTSSYCSVECREEYKVQKREKKAKVGSDSVHERKVVRGIVDELFMVGKR